MSRIHLTAAIVFLGSTTGALQATDSSAGDPISMPPFLVEAPRQTRLHWLYVEAEGLQILSAAMQEDTQAFIQDLRKHRMALRRFIPDELFYQPSLPTTIILFPQSAMAEMDNEMKQLLEDHRVRPDNRRRLDSMSDVRLADVDSLYLFVVVRERHFQPSAALGRQGPRVVLSAEFLRFLIDARAPALPDWFKVGITRFYQADLFLELSPESTAPLLLDRVNAITTPIYNQDEGFEPNGWVSNKEAKRLRTDAHAPRPLLPLREIFIANAPNEKPERYRRIWEAECELFVRWAYSEGIAGGKERLWHFAAAAGVQPITENLFSLYFEKNYTDTRDALSDYLPRSVRESVKSPSPRIESPPRLELRDARPEEIHRIKGEWARRSLRLIRSAFPKALPLYVDKTRELLQRPFDAGERDPELLASLALLEIDLGEPTRARSLLDRFPEAAASRPLASLAKVELHARELLQGEELHSRVLTEGELSGMFQELAATAAQKPPLEGSYVLAVRLLQHAGREPRPEERAFVDEGARLFPRNVGVVLPGASWDLRAGDIEKARTLLELALWEAVDAPAKEKLSVLLELANKASIAGPRAPSDR